MIRYFSADWIFPVSSEPIKDGVIAVDDKGTIVEVLSSAQATGIDFQIKRYEGAIVPGFINTHCHLELSHMLGMVPEKTGLVQFVETIIKGRLADPDEVEVAMQKADQQMVDHGIVAVADISNQTVSKKIKLNSQIYYHTFIEAMGFNPERATAIMAYVNEIREAFMPLPASVVPHAPYSVSPGLFAQINHEASFNQHLLSIHNQETVNENSFFLNKTGEFLDLYKFLGLDISFFKPSGKTSLQTWLPYLKSNKILLVHNTVTSKEDIAFAKETGADLYWCLCPNANLYIEDSLPDVGLFESEDLKMTLGTDSLASNHQLNILAEMKTLQEGKNIGFEQLLTWATKNGAEFLGLENRLGTIEVGKVPGLNVIRLADQFMIADDQVQRIA